MTDIVPDIGRTYRVRYRIRPDMPTDEHLFSGPAAISFVRRLERRHIPVLDIEEVTTP